MSNIEKAIIEVLRDSDGLTYEQIYYRMLPESRPFFTSESIQALHRKAVIKRETWIVGRRTKEIYRLTPSAQVAADLSHRTGIPFEECFESAKNLGRRLT